MTCRARDVQLSVASLFLEALARRDFDELRTCLDPTVRFRALLPPRTLAIEGADETVAQFRTWFGEHEVVELIDASIGQFGSRIYLRWRIRRGQAHEPDSLQVVEQHAFVNADIRIASLDLLCSGFQPNP